MDSNKTSTTLKAFRETRTQVARRLFVERQARQEHFTDSELFGEPAWDILLHLFQGHSQGRGVKIESVALATRLPASAALRWLELLEQNGLVFAYRDETNVTQIYLRLSSKGVVEMGQYLDRIATRAAYSALNTDMKLEERS